MKVSVYKFSVRPAHDKDLYFRNKDEALAFLTYLGPFNQITKVGLRGPEQDDGSYFIYYFSEIEDGTDRFFEYLKENNLL